MEEFSEIRKEVELCFSQIKEAHDKLAVIRAKCRHENGSTTANWSWRIGCIESREICNDCQMPVDDPTQFDVVKVSGGF